MLNLILKDLMYQKTSIRSIVIIMFILFCFQGQLRTEGIYFLIGFAAAYITIEAVEKIEGFRKANNITNSLPVTRKQIVISRYIEVFILQVIAVVFCYVLSLLLSFFGNFNVISFNKLLFAFGFVSIIMCFNLLINFSLKYRVSQLASAILYIIIWISSFTFFLKSSEQDFNNVDKIINFLSFNYFEIQLAAAAFTTIFFIVCILLSIKFYEKKDI